jgi:uncharacterized protein
MIKKLVVFIIMLLFCCPFTIQYSFGVTNPGQIYEGTESLVYRNVTVYAPAVASTDAGYVGVISTITVTIQNNGSGRVFVDTLPLTQVDMQGSARLAVKVASALIINDKNCDVDPATYDYFFVVRTTAPIIGGPSAGAIMTVATISLLENWDLDNQTVMTGMINPDGSIGPIGGIPQKIDAANSVGATRFLFPKGQGTYTEMETKTERSNGWIRTITTPVTKQVADYAMDNYEIVAVDVADIHEAVENFTGYTFKFEESGTPITTEDYITSMKPLATTLLHDARDSYENATVKLQNSSIPNYFPNFYREDVDERLDRAQESLDESQSWYDQGLYYTSTSKSFQSLINSRFVTYACDYYDYPTSAESYIQILLSEVQGIYDNASEKSKDAEINGFISLQSIGAAQRRASEAGIYLEAAHNAYANNQLRNLNDIFDFLYNIAFVVERCNSVDWWIGIGSHFNEVGDLSNATVENIALEYIEEAQQAAIYSTVILSEIGTSYGDSMTYLTEANNLLDAAQNDLDGDLPAAALFEALEALVKANLAIEIIGTNTEDKLDLADESASNNIARTRAQGIESILAVSYFEYAESLRNESSYDSALVYYKYSGMIAGALSFTNITTGVASSRFVGIPETISAGSWFSEETVLLVLLIVTVGLAGLGIGLAIGGISASKREKRTIKKIQETRDIKDYSTRYGRRSYPGDDIPRSIKDYYKKNK